MRTSKLDGVEIPENIPVITIEMMARTIKELTMAWAGMSIGSIVKKKDSDDYYIFLGIVELHQDKEMLDKNDHRLGWFTPFPLKPLRRGYESEIDVCLGLSFI